MLSAKRYSAAGGIIVVALAVAVYWATRHDEPHGPPPPPVSKSLSPIEFVCNGQDVLTTTMALRQSEALVARGACQCDQGSSVQLDRVALVLYVMDNREVTYQSAVMDKTVDGQRVSFSCSSRAPSKSGSYTIRLVAVDPVAGLEETVCEGQLLVE